MRLVSALLGALTAACTVLFIRELAPRVSLGAAVLGGLLVACLPQFAFMSGAVNNDAGITAISAVALWLTARAVRRGLPWPTMLALGAAAALSSSSSRPASRSTRRSSSPIALAALLHARPAGAARPRGGRRRLRARAAR